MTDRSPKPFAHTTVKPEWIDLYGHMNMAYYVLVLDELGHQILERFGLGAGYTQAENRGLFTVDATIQYRKEVREGDRLRVELTPLRFDDKRLWTRVELFNDDQGYLSAVMEQTALNVDLGTRRACAFSEAATASLARLFEQLPPS